MELARGSREFRGLGSSGDYLSKSVTSRETRWSGQWRRAGRKERERAREARSCRPRVAGVALSPGPTVLDRQRGLARGACAGGIAGRRSRWPQLGDPCTGRCQRGAEQVLAGSAGVAAGRSGVPTATTPPRDATGCRSSLVGPGLSATPTTRGRHDRTFRTVRAGRQATPSSQCF